MCVNLNYPINWMTDFLNRGLNLHKIENYQELNNATPNVLCFSNYFTIWNRVTLNNIYV